MAFPPTVPPATRTDSTPQFTNHPGDHNQISAALSDIVNEMGPDPSAGYANVQARLDAIEPLALQGLQVGAANGPYVGNWPTQHFPITCRAGHIDVVTTGFGDFLFNFTNPFPNGIISVQVTPINTGGYLSFWYPQIINMSLTGAQMYAVSSQGYPDAVGHPPSMPNVWTIVGYIHFDFFAIGV
jgi:hypothetical protein